MSVVCSSCFVFPSFLLFCLSLFIRHCVKRGGLAVCAVGGSCISVLFCSLLGGGASGKHCAHVAHYFSHHVFSLFLSHFSSLPPEPHTESARAMRPKPGRISRLSRGPRPRAGRRLPSPHHSQSKCHLLLTCKTLTIAPLAGYYEQQVKGILMGYAIK